MKSFRARSSLCLNRSDFLFCVLYLICMTDAFIIGFTTLNENGTARTISLVLRVIALGIACSKVVVERRHPVKTMIVMVGAGLLTGIAFLKSHYNHLFYIMILFLGFWNVDIERVFRLDLIARITMVVLIVFAALTGLIENYVTYRTGSSVLRYSLGFSHPNTLASIVLDIVLEDAWLHRRRASGLYTVFIGVLAAALYAITRTRTACLILLVFPILLFFIRKDSPVSTRKKRVWEAFGPAIVAFSILFMWLSGRVGVIDLLSRLASNRYVNAMKVYQQYGIPLLGQQVQLVSVKMARSSGMGIALLDVAYLRILIQGGVIMLALVTALYFMAFRKACQYSDRYSILILALFMIYGLFESGFNNVFMNCSMLFAFHACYNLSLPSPRTA